MQSFAPTGRLFIDLSPSELKFSEEQLRELCGGRLVMKGVGCACCDREWSEGIPKNFTVSNNGSVIECLSTICRLYIN